MFNVVLHNPEIPHNTGAAGRLCLATGSTLHLIEPLGFSLDDKQVKRAGLDYWKDVDVRVWKSFEEFSESVKTGTMYFLTTKASNAHWNVSFEKGDYLVFGCETKGLPASILEKNAETAITIPMREDATRSLNLATSVAIVLYEAVRQVGI